mmetsp:Transcript_53797/g.144035  ORF Transcript_53797/g.144035 Transcript_53797/m.144035 type:complete len:476 (-) Transcript_53797:423-1850(-)
MHLVNTSTGRSPSQVRTRRPECAEVVPPQPLEDVPSALSAFFVSFQCFESSETRMDAALADVADASMYSLHQASQRHRPKAQLVLEGLSPAHRQETLVWLLQAFDVLHFPDSVLFETVLLLDRYYACLPREDGAASAQRTLLAAVCTALKTGAPCEQQLPLRHVVNHLGRDQVPYEDVLRAELTMLQQLRFHVGTPTARDFREALSARVSTMRLPTACWSLADFVLQLTLLDAALHYLFPHAILAASTLALAMYTTRAPTEAYLTLLEDLSLQCPDSTFVQASLIQCTAALHHLWVRSVSVSANERNTFANQLCKKFGRANHSAVSQMVPPATPPSSVPPGIGIKPCGSTKDELGQAAEIVSHSLWYDDPRYEDHHTEVQLAGKLRLLADKSLDVHSILIRHGWTHDHFRKHPDLQQLLSDLLNANARKPEKSRRPRRTLGADRQRSGSTTCLHTPAGDQRRRRASSWSGHRAAA